MKPCSIRTDPYKRPTLPKIFNDHYDEIVGLFDEIWAEEKDGLQIIKSRVSAYSPRKNILAELLGQIPTITFAHRGVEYDGKVISLVAFDIIS